MNRTEKYVVIERLFLNSSQKYSETYSTLDDLARIECCLGENEYIVKSGINKEQANNLLNLEIFPPHLSDILSPI
jgi:hypothetical protein